jgi:solute carrier family 25 phosphate transporter 23/24/25/41
VPSFEEFRAQEPPQARLIRLRGLFDVLLDAPDASALADGRAKQEWHRSASRARLGAGGKYARGSMAPPGRADGELEDAAQLQQQQQQGVSAPRQSYASELLDQCRACRAELEREHERERSECGDGWTAWIPFMGSSSAKGEQKKPEKSWAETFGIGSSSSSPAASGSSSSGAASGPASTPPENGSASSPQSDLGSDHEGEAGWVGSGVWGLSAVGAAQRDRDRERDRHVEMGKDVQDDGGRRQRMIEWEGFLRYSDIKERRECDQPAVQRRMG